MTKGKGWGPNVRAKNYQKSYAGFSGGYAGGNIELGSKNREKKKLVKEKRAKRRAMQDRQMSELRKSGGVRSDRWQMLDLEKEKERMARLKRIRDGGLGGSDDEAPPKFEFDILDQVFYYD